MESIKSTTSTAAGRTAAADDIEHAVQRKENTDAHEGSAAASASPLMIGAADDPLEREADAMADKVMRMPATGSLQFSTAGRQINRKCAHCEEEEKQVQRKENNSGPVPAAPSIVNSVLNTGGQSLDTGTRSFMESRFNYDFGNVKIHDNPVAAKSADSINALAYTSGNNIVFNSGQYNPGSNSGKKLLAHELSHVIQQGSGSKLVQRKLRVENPTTALPGTPAKQHWEDIRDSIQTLSKDFDVNNTGLVAPVKPESCKSPARTIDKCLCDMHNAADDWKIQIDDNEFTHTDETAKRVVVQSTRSDMTFGAWGGGSQKGTRIDEPAWRVLGHELCGHGWLMQQGKHPAPNVIVQGGRIMSRPSHDETIKVENEVAKDVLGSSAPERGLHADPHSGESFAIVTVSQFPTNSNNISALPAAQQARLATAEKFMKSNASLKADIIGHADTVGAMASNVTLSEKRAQSIKNQLVTNGVPATRFNVVKGVGEAECTSTGADPNCRKVEIFMYIFEKSSLLFP